MCMGDCVDVGVCVCVGLSVDLSRVLCSSFLLSFSSFASKFLRKGFCFRTESGTIVPCKYTGGVEMCRESRKEVGVLWLVEARVVNEGGGGKPSQRQASKKSDPLGRADCHHNLLVR